MRRIRAILPRFSAVITAVILVQCAWILGMAVNVGWHIAAHHDAGDADHDCAVVLLTHGGWADHGETLVAVPRPPLPVAERALPDTARHAPALFLSWGLLEHAPPGRG